MKILYFGRRDPHATSRHRGEALQRLGCEVVFADPFADSVKSIRHPLLGKLHYRTGYCLVQNGMRRWCAQTVAAERNLDLIWVDTSELFGPTCLQVMRSAGVPTILFNVDDPTGGRDGRRFDMVLKALPEYDLCVTVRACSAKELRARGVRNVLRVKMSYDERMHAPFASSRMDVPAEWRSEVAFIGTWMRHERRDEFLCALIERGIEVSIWGHRWQKSPLWNTLKPSWRGPNIGGRDYVAAILGAKVCLGMLSKGNRDQHTTRSLEVPYAGGLLCAERTTEHLEMYRENVEAVFWSDVDECAQKCRWLLSHPAEAEAIREAGMRRVRELKAGNEDVCRAVLDAIAEIGPIEVARAE